LGLINLAKVLIKYGKTGPLKYLSHLELIRALERALRRAGIDVARSGGFTPRPKISHGPALSVGVASCAEYMLAELVSIVEPDELITRISSALPEGLTIYKAKYIADSQPSIISIVQSAAYRVTVSSSVDETAVRLAVDRVLSEDRLLVKHKGKEKWVDTKEAILEWRVTRTDSKEYQFFLLLSVGNAQSIRPEAAVNKLAEALQGVDASTCEFTGTLDITDICRMEQYANRGNPLLDIYNFYESVKTGSERTNS
jgi:radical SAM-linked protein